jgi:hypothetical protein
VHACMLMAFASNVEPFRKKDADNLANINSVKPLYVCWDVSVTFSFDKLCLHCFTSKIFG